MSWSNKIKPKQFKTYFWGIYFKGSSYHEIRIKFTHYTIMFPIVKGNHCPLKLYRELRRH